MAVLKFGGSSVESAARIRAVISIIKQIINNQQPVQAVVVSALSGVTNSLVELSSQAMKGVEEYRPRLNTIAERHYQILHELIAPVQRGEALAWVKGAINELDDLLYGISLTKECSLKTRDAVLGFGEQLSAYCVAKCLSEAQLPARYVDARTIIKTDSSFGAAHVDYQASLPLIEGECNSSCESLAVITGFIGSDGGNNPTTLGRGGSDHTAAVIGSALNTNEIQIWSDVDGMMSADPRLVKKAISLDEISYEEAMELSHFGAKVLYPPSIQPAFAKDIPIRIKNTLNPTARGTLIHRSPNPHPFSVTGIASIAQTALFRIEGPGMQGITGTAMRVFKTLAEHRVNVILISQASSEHSICFAVDPADATKARSGLNQEFVNELHSGVLEAIVATDNFSIISVVGENMRSTPGTSAKLFGALGQNGINVAAIAQGSSELNISVVIPSLEQKKALNAVHDAFFLSQTRSVNLFMIGYGLIGRTLTGQIASNQERIRETYHVNLEVHGVTNSSKMILSEDPLSLTDLDITSRTDLKTADLHAYIHGIKSLNLPNSVVIDTTASALVPQKYAELLGSSIKIVTPNKKGLAGSLEQYLAIKLAAAKGNTTMLYETCVGAGLPVISTLIDLLKSGDEIIEIQAVLSGTLSFIFNSLNPDSVFSEVVKDAQAKGYTEPDPRDDLSGTDVGRKLLILAREIGYPLELVDIPIENLVPDDCRGILTTPEFYEALAKHDGAFSDRLKAAAANKGKKLCYIASIRDGKAFTSLQEIDSIHPFYNLSGSDNIISFRTNRYDSRPLVVKGPGAGATVTAAGVFADIVRL